jgi:uncharacterized membrane protein YkvA (DUF1232 family)
MNTENNPNDKKLPLALVVITGIVGLLYLLNPTMGFLELIPDNLPIVGNLDEGAAAVLVWNAIQTLRTARKSR